jgi:hypothetical protein
MTGFNPDLKKPHRLLEKGAVYISTTNTFVGFEKALRSIHAEAERALLAQAMKAKVEAAKGGAVSVAPVTTPVTTPVTAQRSAPRRARPF